jgi:antitoxin component YwqK of YwqJK toxin-antitoxin module
MTVSKSRRHLHYHKDGSLWAKGRLRGKAMVGRWEWYRKDGSIMRAGSFNDRGEQTGEWTTYAADGRVVKVTTIRPKKPAAAKRR